MIARKGYKPLINVSKAEDSMVLGESYEEAAGLVDTVLAEAAKRGDGNVVCILDQNMEFPAGLVLGTEVTSSLRAALRNKFVSRQAVVSSPSSPSPLLRHIQLPAAFPGPLPPSEAWPSGS